MQNVTSVRKAGEGHVKNGGGGSKQRALKEEP